MRRANGTGNIVDLGGNRRRRYAVRVAYLARPGLWKQKYLSYHRTAREAQEALEAHLRRDIPTRTLAVTLGDVYDQWSARKYARAGAASVASYKASWARLSALAGKEMFKVTVDDLQAIIDRDELSGLGKSSISNDKLLMKALYKHAMERDVVTKDCSAFVELPSVGPKVEKGAFTEEQMAALERMAAEGMPWADTVLILCYTGFRVSELLALIPASYHPEEGCLQGGMKTAAGRDRLVPVHPKILPHLTAWLAKEGRAIICREDGAPVTSQWYREHAFAPVAAALGIPQATPHWCRHTAASRMKRYGVDDLAARRILGHANKDITEHYTHIDAAVLRREIQRLP